MPLAGRRLQFAHMPLILAPGGGKLSKRHGSTAMEEFRAQGYLPEALMNYLALLGWSFDGTTEMFSRDDLLEKFTLERVSPSPGTFDYNKLRWFNQQYINHILSLDDLTVRVMPFLGGGRADRAGPVRTGAPRFRSRAAGSRAAQGPPRNAGRGAGADGLFPSARAGAVRSRSAGAEEDDAGGCAGRARSGRRPLAGSRPRR